MRGLVLTIFAVVWTAVLVLTGARFLALLADANRDSTIVEGLYESSEILVEPFFNMFSLSNEGVEGGGTFEPASLIAFAVYLIAGLVIGALLSGAPIARLGQGRA